MKIMESTGTAADFFATDETEVEQEEGDQRNECKRNLFIDTMLRTHTWFTSSRKLSWNRGG